MIKRIEKFIDKFNSYFVLPLLAVFLLSYLSQEYATSKIGIAVNIIFIILFVAYLVFVIFKICKKAIKNQSLIWVLVMSLVLIVLSFIMSYGDNGSISDMFFIAGVIFFETYALFIIIQCCFSKKNMITKAIIFSLAFIILGYYVIYLSTYNLSDISLFNSLITVFSAIIGGGITLVGVALGIRNTDKNRREDEINKAKPLLFVFNYKSADYKDEKFYNINVNSIDCKGSLKRANDNEKSYKLDVIPIKNVDHSYCSIIGFKVNSEYHLFDIGQVLPKNSFIMIFNNFKFKISGEINKIALLLKDMLDTIYEMEVKIKTTKKEKITYIEIESGIEIKKTGLDLDPKTI